MNRRTFWMVAALGLALAVPSFSFAQEERGGRERGGERGGDRGDFRERMMNDLKERLGAKDDEWQVLQPKIEKVTAARMSGMSFGGFGGRGPGGPGGRGGDSAASSPVQTAARELNTALENKDTPSDQIQAKLTALREARAKAKAELEAAQKDLKEVVTPRQEAVLVSRGMLD